MRRIGNYITQGVYTVSGPFHPFGGAVDVVVVEQPDGTFKSSPWYVRFGKFQGVLKATEKVVDITVNEVDSNFHMYLDHKGEAFFLREIDAEEGESIMYPSSGDDTDDYRSLGSKNYNSDSESVKVMDRNSSRRGLMFGPRSMKGGVEGGDVSRSDSLESAEIAADLLDLKWSTNLTGNRPPRKGRNKTPSDNIHNALLNQPELIEEASSNSNIELGQEKSVIDLSTMTDHHAQGETQTNGKEILDLQVACVELEARIEKQLNGEEVSCVSIVDAPANNVSQEDISADGVHSLVGCEASESSKVDLYCSSEVLYLASGGSGEGHVNDEVLHGTTVLLPEGTETEDVTKNVDLGMPVMEASEFHSRAQQTDYSDSDVSMYDVPDVEGLPESNYVMKPSSSRRLDDQTFDENNIKDKDVSSTFSSPLESLDDCLPTKATRRSPSAISEEENFFFSDLDESRIHDKFEESTFPEYVDKEDQLSYENGTEKVDHLVCTNCDLHSSLENSTTENQKCDHEKLRVISSPIAIPGNDTAGEEVGHTGSLPNVSSCGNGQGQHDVCYPLSQSLDSKSKSLQWTFPGKKDFECLKSNEGKQNQLLHEEPGAKDYHSSGEFKSTALKLPIGDPSTHGPSPGGNWRIWPFSLRRSESTPVPPTPSDALNTTFGNSSEDMISTNANKNELKPNLWKKKVREKVPTTEQLASLNLKEGRNTVTFTFSTAMLGRQQVDARIYLWKWNTRIVISDVDGTITKSDVLGQFMPLVGIDWSQTGVAHLFSAIKENGYRLLFLSARSISQAYLTRQFLVNLIQDGKVLPDGPVVISPDGLFPSLYREVIRRVPHEFKIACLEEIKALFPSDCNPFYAGFGNRDTDEISYLKVGIPIGKIFIINPRGEIVVNRRLDTKSYTSLHALVNGMFPPMNFSEQEDFNSWNYWKLSLPVIDI